MTRNVQVKNRPDRGLSPCLLLALVLGCNGKGQSTTPANVQLPRVASPRPTETEARTALPGGVAPVRAAPVPAY
jgi:hypothetical protein